MAHIDLQANEAFRLYVTWTVDDVPAAGLDPMPTGLLKFPDGTESPITLIEEALTDRYYYDFQQSGGGNYEVVVWCEDESVDMGAARRSCQLNVARTWITSIAAIKAKTDGIGATVEYTGPVSTSGRVRVFQGKDYAAADGTALTWHSTSLLNLEGADVTLDVNGESFTGTVSGEPGDWTISVELTRAQTTALPVFVHGYELSAELANGRIPPPLAFGSMQVIGER